MGQVLCKCNTIFWNRNLDALLFVYHPENYFLLFEHQLFKRDFFAKVDCADLFFPVLRASLLEDLFLKTNHSKATFCSF